MDPVLLIALVCVLCVGAVGAVYLVWSRKPGQAAQTGDK